MPENMEKNPDKMQNPKDQDRKLESGLGSHCRSTSAFTPNMITDIVMKAAENRERDMHFPEHTPQNVPSLNCLFA